MIPAQPLPGCDCSHQIHDIVSGPCQTPGCLCVLDLADEKSTLPSFLLARFAEEKWALDALVDDDPNDPGYFSPSRLATECDARQRIVEHYEANNRPYLVEDVLRLLALPYADHPDYRPEWKP